MAALFPLSFMLDSHLQLNKSNLLNVTGPKPDRQNEL